MDQKHLDTEESKARKNLNVTFFEKSRGNLKDTSTLGKSRRYIATIRSIVNERKAEEKSAAPAVK